MTRPGSSTPSFLEHHRRHAATFVEGVHVLVERADEQGAQPEALRGSSHVTMKSSTLLVPNVTKSPRRLDVEKLGHDRPRLQLGFDHVAAHGGDLLAPHVAHPFGMVVFVGVHLLQVDHPGRHARGGMSSNSNASASSTSASSVDGDEDEGRAQGDGPIRRPHRRRRPPRARGCRRARCESPRRPSRRVARRIQERAMRGGADRRALARDPRTRVGVARVKRAIPP